MKVTKQYCDNPGCMAETDRLYAVDIELPIEFQVARREVWDLPIGRSTVDGVWEIELCKDCIDDLCKMVREWGKKD